MTREEAIRELMFAKREVIEDSFIDKAYDMAISALKAQGTCEDAVSRQTLQKELALYLIDDVTSEDEAGYNRAINDVQKMVLHLPSAQPDNRLSKIDDLVEGTIDHFDLDDAMDLLYQIKDVLDGSDELPSAQTNLDRIYAELSKAYNVPGLPEEAIGIIGDLMVSLDEPSAQPEPSQVARDIATIIENEQDMRVVLKNAQNDIVHCRNCNFCHKSLDWKHLQSFGMSIWRCGKCRGLNAAETVNLDDYCSSAERRTDGNGRD